MRVQGPRIYRIHTDKFHTESTEPTNEARAEAKLVLTMPCKEEEDDSQTTEIIQK